MDVLAVGMVVALAIWFGLLTVWATRPVGRARR
jgi:hypothetical protein